jgi:hypothetical protein
MTNTINTTNPTPERTRIVREPIHATIEPVLAYAKWISEIKREPFSVVTIPPGTAAYRMGYRYVSVPNTELPYYIAGGAALAKPTQPIEGAKLPPRVSAEMKQARVLLWTGLTGYAASKQTGISEGAISKCKVCQAIIQSVTTAKICLSTDETSTDNELYEFFKRDLGMSENHARAWIKQREHFQAHPFVDKRKKVAAHV